MITLLVTSSILSILIAWFAWVGIGHYKEFSEDEDKDVTSKRLRTFILVILLVLLSCNAIMGYTKYTETKTHELVLEQK